jgi:hypothetical protein
MVTLPGSRSPARARAWAVVASLAAATALVACGEQIEGGAACPILCPQQNVTVLDTVFDPITIDSSLAPFPSFGTEALLVLGARGDSLDTRAVIRFDSLNPLFNKAGVDSTITAIDSAHLLVHIDRTRSVYSQPVTIQVFDVDTVESDTSVTAERELFRSDRLLGSITFDSSKIADSLFIPVDSARVMSAILDRTRLRLGLRATSAAPVMLHIVSTEGGISPSLRYDPSPDTAVHPVAVVPNTPRPLPSVLAADYRDYLLIFKSPPDPGAGLEAVGGIPGHRTYLRFNIPSHILDSSTVLRATLLLTASPDRGLDADKPFTMYPQLVTAGLEVTDLARSALLLAPAAVGFDTVVVTPRDSGLVAVEIVNALRTWSLSTAKNSQHALVLRAPDESFLPHRLTFFSSSAPAALRPRLRVNYSPLAKFGIP